MKRNVSGRCKRRMSVWMAAFLLLSVVLQGCAAKGGGEESDTIRWFNASYAILTELNHWDYNTFPGIKINENTQNMEIASLKASWDVTDRQSADETLDWVLSEGHRADFVESALLLEEAGMGEIPAGQRAAWAAESFGLSEDDAEYFVMVYDSYEAYGEGAIDAWDYSRALNLLSFYYIAGYYTREEALDKALEIAQTVQPEFDSWDEYVESYLRGYEFWAEESSDERRGVYEDLKSREDNPYAVDYHTTLEKTW